MTNLSKIMNWDAVKVVTESDIALRTIGDVLARYNQVADPTDLYASTLAQSIVTIRDYLNIYMSEWCWETADEWAKMKPLPYKEYEVLLKYLRELESVIQVKSKLGYRHTPADDVQFVDDL